MGVNMEKVREQVREQVRELFKELAKAMSLDDTVLFLQSEGYSVIHRSKKSWWETHEEDESKRGERADAFLNERMGVMLFFQWDHNRHGDVMSRFLVATV